MENEDGIVNLFDEGSEQPAQQAAPELVAEPAPFEVPKKFEGKTLEDVVEAYTNLEKEHGRKSNEVGELRKLTDDILRQQAAPTVEPPEYINESVDELDFYEDPNAAVDKALANNPRLRRIEEQMLKDVQTQSHAELIALHSDADEVVASDGFNTWVQGSSGRLKMLQDAHNNHDVSLASDIIDMYKTTATDVSQEARDVRDANASDGLKAVSMESGSPAISTGNVYRRADLIRLKVEQPARYASMADEIRQAYADGRVK